MTAPIDRAAPAWRCLPARGALADDLLCLLASMVIRVIDSSLRRSFMPADGRLWVAEPTLSVWRQVPAADPNQSFESRACHREEVTDGPDGSPLWLADSETTCFHDRGM